MLAAALVLSVYLHVSFSTLNNVTHFWNHPDIHNFKMGNQIINKGIIEGCLFKESIYEPIVCIVGYDCKKYPFSFKTYKRQLKIKMTSIQVIRTNDLKQQRHLNFLSIEYNLELNELELGCFHNMTELIFLKITLNPKLTYLEENIFDGLINLKQLSLRKNGFDHIVDISNTVTPNKVPSLRYLDLSENLFNRIDKKSLTVMNGSLIEDLKLTLCGIDFIHEDSLIVFNNLVSLDLGQNHFDILTITKVILKFVEHGVKLESIALYDLGYRERPPMQVLEAISVSSITTLSLAKNQLEQLNRNDFPEMPNIRSLDLSDNIIIVIETDTFQGFNNLNELYLSGNKFTKILPGLLLPQLRVLDLRMLTGKIGAVSYLNIPNNIFTNMTELRDLGLSFNLIESLTKSTFSGLDNLLYLEMQNATIYGIDVESFEHLKKLNVLNLDNNPLKTLVPKAELFKGLVELQILHFGGCSLSNISINPSPFYYLENLTYLGLNNNVIYTITPNVFAPLKNLQILDLSFNKLIPWTDRLIVNPGLKFLDVAQNKFTFFTSAMLDDFEMVEHINLDGNPIICDCNLFPSNIEIGQLLNYNNTKIFNIKCSNLDQQKAVLDYIYFLKENPRFCTTSNSSNNALLVVILAFFICLIAILLVLTYIYRHYVKYWLFLAKITIQRHSKWWKKDYCEQYPNFKYDAFVSYSCEDVSFINILVSELEENEPKLKLCLYERDFKIGSVISEEVLHGVLQSRRTLLIISDGFAKSHWCRWETKLAEYHRIFFRNKEQGKLDDTLVMVKLGDISKSYITPTLKYLLKTRIYLEWDLSKEKEFWEKLRAALIAPKTCKRKLISTSV